MGAAKRSLRNRHRLPGGTASQRPGLQLHPTPSIQRPGLHLCPPCLPHPHPPTGLPPPVRRCSLHPRHLHSQSLRTCPRGVLREQLQCQFCPQLPHKPPVPTRLLHPPLHTVTSARPAVPAPSPHSGRSPVMTACASTPPSSPQRSRAAQAVLTRRRVPSSWCPTHWRKRAGAQSRRAVI